MNEDAYWSPLVPELTVTQLEASLRFYFAAGFTLRFRREAPAFAYLELGQAQIMLEEEHADGWRVASLERPLGRGLNFQLEVDDVDATWAALAAAGYAAFEAMKESWYAVDAETEEGQREFLIQDPDGYLFRFAQPLGSRQRG